MLKALARNSQYIWLFCFSMKGKIFEHGVLTHSSYYTLIRLFKALWSFDHSECNMIPNVESSSSYYGYFASLKVRYLSMVS